MGFRRKYEKESKGNGRYRKASSVFLPLRNTLLFAPLSFDKLL
jgi:hypothetical protein